MSLTVLCPNGHRQKVSTTPNMSLQQVLETVCAKKGFEAGRHMLMHHRKKLDLSSTVRFSGLPNNCLIEMEELSEDELRNLKDSKVSVCLQVGSGERLVEEFTCVSTLQQVISAFPQDKIGQPEQGEEAVVVYLRNEIIGDSLKSTTLKSLGLTSGKGLFRFFYKKPETLKEQANVYLMKERTPEARDNKSEERHLPMRMEAATLASLQPPPKESQPEQETSKQEQDSPEDLSVTSVRQQSTTSSSTTSRPTTTPTPSTSRSTPDSTTVEEEQTGNLDNDCDAVINPVGPHEAIIFPNDGSVKFTLPDDGDEDFFEYTLEDVKGRYKQLRLEVKELNDGEALLTSEMRASREEGEKLSLLGRYKSALVRIQLPTRHTVQGVFRPHTTVGEIKDWLRPLLLNPELPLQLYIVPPRTELENSSSLLDLNLVPASLIHLSSPQSESQDLLKPEYLDQLSNIQGANKAASEFRKGKKKRETGIQGEFRVPETLSSIPESSRTGKRSNNDTEGPSVPPSCTTAPKMPKWFKPGK